MDFRCHMCVWPVICILSTLDERLSPSRWFLQPNAAGQQSPIFSLIPESVIASPIPVFIFASLFRAVRLLGRQT